jgi:hypothetical protein
VSLAFYIVSVYIASMPTWITIRTFIAVFFALFGLRLIASLDEMRCSQSKSAHSRVLECNGDVSPTDLMSL